MLYTNENVTNHCQLHLKLHITVNMLQTSAHALFTASSVIYCRTALTVAEWLACWIQTKKGLGLDRRRDAVR